MPTLSEPTEPSKLGDILQSSYLDDSFMAKTLADMLAEREKLDAQIEQMKTADRTDGINRIHDIMTKLGLTVADLRASPKAAKKGSAAGSTVAPQYRDPETGSTWSGRGLMPKWMKASGKPKEAFAIAKK